MGLFLKLVVFLELASVVGANSYLWAADNPDLFGPDAQSCNQGLAVSSLVAASVSPVKYLITVDLDAVKMDSVVEQLKLLGIEPEQVLEVVGIIVAGFDPSLVETVKGIFGVLAVEQEQIIEAL